mmetsp:Transcript_123831/g.214682  ORF Transcript_123831/g.214682 Transcript_123831/m.214682 type:complete len:317 (+) Transcript_123831:88-1038(+)
MFSAMDLGTAALVTDDSGTKPPCDKRGKCPVALRKRRRVIDSDQDELLLPPAVRRVRRRDPDHWANVANGWRPPPKKWAPPSATGETSLASLATLPDLRNPMLVVSRCRRMRVLQRQKSLRNSSEDSACCSGGESSLNSDDDPKDDDMLSPEESAAKCAIWDECNQDMLQFLKHNEEREKERKEQQAKAKREKEKAMEAQRARKERLARAEEQVRAQRSRLRSRVHSSTPSSPPQDTSPVEAEPEDEKRSEHDVFDDSAMINFFQAGDSFGCPNQEAEQVPDAAEAVQRAHREQRDQQRLSSAAQSLAAQVLALFE